VAYSGVQWSTWSTVEYSGVLWSAVDSGEYSGTAEDMTKGLNSKSWLDQSRKGADDSIIRCHLSCFLTDHYLCTDGACGRATRRTRKHSADSTLLNRGKRTGEMPEIRQEGAQMRASNVVVNQLREHHVRTCAVLSRFPDRIVEESRATLAGHQERARSRC